MRPTIATLIGLILTAGFLGCGPSVVAPGGLTPVLTISGQLRIPPGSTTQLRVIAKSPDGSSKDVTSTVAWRSSDATILTIDTAGLATGHQSGQAIVTAALPSTSTTQRMVVIPAGTFTLTGRVSWASMALVGASVQVTAGIGAGLATVTDALGSYQLYGVAGPIALTVSEAAYGPIQQTPTITADTTLDFQLQPAAPLPPFTGTYALQISADPACATAGPLALPAAARIRRYTATVIDGSTGVRATANGANFLPQTDASYNDPLRNLIAGYVTPAGVSMDVNLTDYYYGIVFPPPDFAEVLPDGTIFCPSGSITLTPNGPDYAGTLNGTLYVRSQPSGTAVGECTSTHHGIAFTRLSSTAGAGRRR